MSDFIGRIKPKKSSTASEVPLASDLEVSEIAVNTADGKLFTKHTDNSIKEIGGGGGATTIDDLTDVDTTTVAPSNGDILQYDGSNWVTGVGNSSIVDGGNWESGTSTGGGLLVDGGVIT
jgi:hypothetical protein